MSLNLKVLLFVYLSQVLGYAIQGTHLKVEYKNPSSIKEISAEAYGFGIQSISDSEASISPNVLLPGSVTWEPGSGSITDESDWYPSEDISEGTRALSSERSKDTNSSDTSEGSTFTVTIDSLQLFLNSAEDCRAAVEALGKGSKDMHELLSWVSSGLPAPKHKFQISSLGLLQKIGETRDLKIIRGPQAWGFEIPLPEAWVDLLEDMPPIPPDSCFPLFKEEWLPPGTPGHPGYYLLHIATPLGVAGCLISPKAVLAAAMDTSNPLQVLAYPLPVGYEHHPFRGWSGKKDAATFEKGVHVVVEISLIMNETDGDSEQSSSDSASCFVHSNSLSRTRKRYNGPKRRVKAPKALKSLAQIVNLPDSKLYALEYSCMAILLACSIWLIRQPFLLLFLLSIVGTAWVINPNWCGEVAFVCQHFLRSIAVREETPLLATSSKYTIKLERAMFVHALIGFPVVQIKAFKAILGMEEDEDVQRKLPVLLSEPEPAWMNEDTKKRFLTAKHSVDESRQLAEMTKAWRKKLNVDSLLENPPKTFSFFMRNIPHHVMYTNGRRVALRLEVGKVAELVAAMKAADLSPEGFELHLAFLHEYMWNILAKTQLPDGRMDQIIDMKRFSLSHMMGETKEMFFALMQVGNYYPERLGKCVVLNPPGWFNFVWNFVAPFLDENTKARIEVLSNKTHMVHELGRMLTPEMVPQCYSGPCTIPMDEYPVHRELLDYVRSKQVANGEANGFSHYS